MSATKKLCIFTSRFSIITSRLFSVSKLSTIKVGAVRLVGQNDGEIFETSLNFAFFTVF